MKLISVCLAGWLTVLSLASTGFGQPPERSGRPGPSVEPAGERTSRMQAQLAQRLRKQIEELKANHQDLVAELRRIHAAAVQEKATETAKKIEQLISKRQETFQGRLRQMERQQQRLQRAAREAAGPIERPQRRGRRAPDFELSSFDGKKIKSADYRGKIVVLEWFNMECPFSRYHYATTRTMADLAAKYKDKDVVWLAVNSTSHTTAEANLEFTRKHNLTYPMLDDRSGKVGRSFGARTTPHMFIIDKGGFIVYNGAIDSAPLGKVSGDGGKLNYVDKALAELTSGKKVSLPATPPYGCSVKYASR